MGIDLRGRDAGVAEEALDEADIHALFDEQGRRAVAEHVGRDTALDRCDFSDFAQSLAQRL